MPKKRQHAKKENLSYLSLKIEIGSKFSYFLAPSGESCPMVRWVALFCEFISSSVNEFLHSWITAVLKIAIKVVAAWRMTNTSVKFQKNSCSLSVFVHSTVIHCLLILSQDFNFKTFCFAGRIAISCCMMFSILMCPFLIVFCFTLLRSWIPFIAPDTRPLPGKKSLHRVYLVENSCLLSPVFPHWLIAKLSLLLASF